MNYMLVLFSGKNDGKVVTLPRKTQTISIEEVKHIISKYPDYDSFEILPSEKFATLSGIREDLIGNNSKFTMIGEFHQIEALKKEDINLYNEMKEVGIQFCLKRQNGEWIPLSEGVRIMNITSTKTIK